MQANTHELKARAFHSTARRCHTVCAQVRACVDVCAVQCWMQLTRAEDPDNLLIGMVRSPQQRRSIDNRLIYKRKLVGLRFGRIGFVGIPTTKQVEGVGL